MVVLWGVCLYNWLANVNISAYINKSNLTSNLTSVTLEMRLRSNLPIYAGRAWSYCGGLVIIGIRRGLNNKGQLFSCFGHCASLQPRYSQQDLAEAIFRFCQFQARSVRNLGVPRPFLRKLQPFS